MNNVGAVSGGHDTQLIAILQSEVRFVQARTGVRAALPCIGRGDRMDGRREHEEIQPTCKHALSIAAYNFWSLQVHARS